MNADITTHEILHTFVDTNNNRILDGSHTQHKDSIPYTVTRHSDGAQANHSDGVSVGAAGAGIGGRLRVMSVSDAKNTANPANNYNNDSTLTYDYTHYFQGGITVDIPYAGMSNPASQGNVADGVANFYDGTTPARNHRYDSVAALAQPVVNINGDKLNTSNIAGNYDNLYVANTTHPAYDTIYRTKRNVRSYLYDITNQGNDQFLWHGDVGDTVDLSDEGLNVNATYVMKVGTFIGNSVSSTSLPIFAGDTTAPIAIAKSDTIYLNQTGNATANPANFDNGSSDNKGIVSKTLDKTNFDCTDIGTQPINLIVTDAMGNSDTASTQVTVLDTLAPVLTTRNIVASLDSNGIYVINPNDLILSLAENCTMDTTTISPDTLYCGDIGIKTINITSTDIYGNSVTKTATVTLTDTIAPDFSVTDTTVYLDTNGNIPLNISSLPTNITENCSISTPTYTPASPLNCNHTGPNTIQITVPDINGNSTTKSLVLTILDTIKPTVLTKTFNENVADGSPITILPADVDDGSFDNCNISTLSVFPNHFTTADAGANTVWLKGTDGSGNIDSTSAIVNISNVTGVDETNPLSQVSLYPNPTTGVLNIKNGENIEKITIFDAVGRATPMYNPKGLDKIDLSIFPTGIYFIKLEDDQGRVVTKKVVKK